MSTRYGVKWPDGLVTGGITDSYRLAASYAKDHDGTVYEIPARTRPGDDGDQECGLPAWSSSAYGGL